MLKYKCLFIALFFCITSFLFGDQFLLRLALTKGMKFRVKEVWRIKRYTGKIYTISMLIENNVISQDSTDHTAKIRTKLISLKVNNVSRPTNKIPSVYIMTLKGEFVKILNGSGRKRQSLLPLPDNYVMANSVWKTFLTAPIKQKSYVIPVKARFSSLTNNHSSQLVNITFSGENENIVISAFVMKISLKGETVFDLTKKYYRYIKMKINYYGKAGTKWRLMASGICRRTITRL